MTLNGLIVDFIALGGAVILTAAGMGVVLLLTEDRRGRIFMQEIPARFRHLVRDPGGTPSEWVKPLHARAPSALRAARHLAGLGHLLRPKGLSEGRAAKLARQLHRRALLARIKTSPAGGTLGRTATPRAAISTTRSHTQPEAVNWGAWPGTPAAAGGTRPGALPPLPDLPPDDLDASCTYTDRPPLASYLSDDTLARGELVAIRDGA